MKNLEITIISSEKLIHFAPTFYRSNKIIIIANKEPNYPKRCAGNYVYNLNSPLKFYDIAVKISDEYISLSKQGRVYKIKIAKHDGEFGYRLNVPMDESVDRSSYALLLKEAYVPEEYSEESESIGDIDSHTESVVEPVMVHSEVGPIIVQPVKVSEVAQDFSIEEDEVIEIIHESEECEDDLPTEEYINSEDELFESEEEEEENFLFEEDDYEESEG